MRKEIEGDEYLIKIERKVIDELYAFHGMEAVKSLIDVIKEEIAIYIQSRGDAYYIELMQKLRKEMLNIKKENVDAEMENR